MTYRLTECRVCHHVYCIEDSDGCPKCAQNAATERVLGTSPAKSLAPLSREGGVNPGAILGLLMLPVAAHADAFRFGYASVTFDGVEVTFNNGLTSARDFPSEFSFELTEGITVQVIILHGPGTTPDVMYVIPPAGYFAVPESVTVDEDATGVIAIYGGVS